MVHESTFVECEKEMAVGDEGQSSRLAEKYVGEALTRLSFIA